MVQEMASRGLSAVYQLGDEGGRAELLESLMGTLQGAQTRAIHVRSAQCMRHEWPTTGLVHGPESMQSQAPGPLAAFEDMQVEQRSVQSS